MDFPRAAGVSLTLLLLVVMAFAGCVDDDDNDGGRDPNTNNQGGPGDRQQERGTIRGVVEGLGGPLAGARVDISNIFDSTTTDSEGRFEFDDLAQAQYRLTFTAEYHRRTTQTVLLEGGAEESIAVELAPVMLTADVPAKYGLQTRPVNAQDTLLFSLGLPGLTQTAMTNETMDATFPGFWEIEPEDGYLIAHVTVVIGWFELPDLEQGLAMHYFRGESPVENELTEGDTSEYHRPDPYMSGAGFAYYLLTNDDWDKWGDRHWQLGVYVKDDDGAPALAGAAVEHVIQVVVTMVDKEYAASL